MINEAGLRLGCFVTVLVIMMVWEAATPNRHSPVTTAKRWRSNFGLLLCSSLLARLLVPAGLTAAGYYTVKYQFGLLPAINLPYWVQVASAVIALDCLIYWQHRLLHKVPLLWRMHRVHHADPHLDASSGLRFHPLEIAFSLAIKALGILLLGAPPEAVLIFEIVLNGTAVFNHSNIKLPPWLEWPLRSVIVTQAMHRIHHSQIKRETDSNFGFNLSLWDRLFGSYRAHAAAGDDGLILGLADYPDEKTNTGLLTLLLMPFRR